MEQRYKAFLLVAQTLSMSRAAEISFVSPQCISGHIRSLEKEYDVSLFSRYPSLNLTPEGVALWNQLQKMEAIENGISKSLQNATIQTRTKISLGLPGSRYTLLLKTVAMPYINTHPLVELELFDDRNSETEWRVVNGILDMAISSRQTSNPEITRTPLLSELYFFLVSKKLMKETYGDDFTRYIEKYKKGIRLQDLADFPLAMNSAKVSRLRRKIDEYLEATQINYNIIFETNRFDVVDYIARYHMVAGMVPYMMIDETNRNNLSAPEEEFVFAFPVLLDCINFENAIYLITRKNSVDTIQKKELIQHIKTQFSAFQAEQDHYYP